MFNISLLSLLLFLSDEGIPGDRIAARIENEVILLSELSLRAEILTGNQVEYDENDPNVSKFYQKILNEMIEDRLISLELKRMGQDVTDGEVNATISVIHKQSGYNEDDFIRLLLKEGLTYDKYKEEIKRQVRKDKFVALKIRPRVKISDEDARVYYNQEFSKKRSRKSYDISMIFLSALKSKSETTTLSDRLNLVKDEILKKREFSEIAKRYSDDPSASTGGHLHIVSPGDLRTEFEDAISKLNEGEISDPIKSAEGYYIFRLNKVIQPEIKDFSEAKEDIKKMLFEKEMIQQYSYVINSLKKKYTIHINLR